MDALGWPLPTCSYCNYSLVQFSSLIQKSYHWGCISHGQGVKAIHRYVVAPSKLAAAQREQWQGTSACHCQELDVWPGVWKGKEGRVELKNKTGTIICRESCRYLIMGLVHPHGQGQMGLVESPSYNADPSDAAQEGVSEAKGWHMVTVGWMCPASTLWVYLLQRSAFVLRLKMKTTSCFPDLQRKGSPAGHSCAWTE